LFMGDLVQAQIVDHHIRDREPVHIRVINKGS
jgi:hypothetical protein